MKIDSFCDIKLTKRNVRGVFVKILSDRTGKSKISSSTFSIDSDNRLVHLVCDNLDGKYVLINFSSEKCVNINKYAEICTKFGAVRELQKRRKREFINLACEDLLIGDFRTKLMVDVIGIYRYRIFDNLSMVCHSLMGFSS